MFAYTAAGIFFAGSIASWVRVYCLGTSTDIVNRTLRKELYCSYLQRDVELLHQEKTGELLTILDKDVTRASEAYTKDLANGLRSLNSSINGSILLFSMSPQLCAVSLSVVPVVGIGAMFMKKYARKVEKRLRELEGDVMNYVLERLEGMSSVKLNGREDLEMEKFDAFNDECYSLSQNTHFSEGAFMSFINVATNLSLVAVLSYGGLLLSKKKMTPGDLTRFAIQSAFVGLGFAGLSNAYSSYSKSLDAASRVFDQIDINNHETKIIDSKKDDSMEMIGTRLEKGGVEVKNVIFSYRSRPEEKVLKGISLTAPSNSITAVVGRSGSGKSTLLLVMCGLYCPSSSDGIWIGDRKLIYGDSPWAKETIGVLEQNATLFSGTIYENIAYGKIGSTADEVQNAAKLACAHDFIESLSDKYNTQVGESGNEQLSGGQKVRIALARALIRDPKCLFLDEVTSSLDTESESDLIQILISLSKKKTIVVFTHSTTLMKAASRIHLMSEGKIEQSGEYKRIAPLMAIR